MGFEERSQHLRLLAFGAVVLSTAAVAACMVTFPMVFHYVIMLQADIQTEISFCRANAKTMLIELTTLDMSRGNYRDAVDTFSMLKVVHPSADPKIVKRQAQADFGNQINLECCTCHFGPPGPAGPPGSSGRDGTDGGMGIPGNNGPDAEAPVQENIFPEQCPCEADPGPGGPPGSKGPPGPGGDDGAPGSPGGSGGPGPQGPKGPSGPDGQPGNPGADGSPGSITPEAGPTGGPGAPGSAGSPGSPGTDGSPGEGGGPGPAGPPGDAGGPGQPGADGGPGDAGNPGGPGPNGPCDHCPAARLAPGY